LEKDTRRINDVLMSCIKLTEHQYSTLDSEEVEKAKVVAGSDERERVDFLFTWPCPIWIPDHQARATIVLWMMNALRWVESLAQ
jgi:hypothetical protein